MTAIASAAAASAAVSTATQKLNRASALRVAVRSTCFVVRPERGTFNQLLPRYVVGGRGPSPWSGRPQRRCCVFAAALITTPVSNSATISQSTLPVTTYTTAPTIAATITRMATNQKN